MCERTLIGCLPACPDRGSVRGLWVCRVRLQAAEPHWPGPSNVTLKKKKKLGGGGIISEFQKSCKKSTKKSLHSDSPKVTFY